MLPSGELDRARSRRRSRASCAAVMTPATSGRLRSRHQPTFSRVDDEALAEHRVERAVDARRATPGCCVICHARKSWYLRTGQRVGVVDADRALQPPVRRVQRVRVVRAAQRRGPPPRASARARAGGRCARGRRACRGSRWSSAQQTRSGQRVGTVTAMRPPGRSTRTSSAIAPLVGPDVLEHLRRDDAVEGARRGTAGASASPLTVAAGRVRAAISPASSIAPTTPRTSLSSPLVVVERDDRRAAPHRLERVPAAAAAHVEQAVRRRAGRADRSRRSALSAASAGRVRRRAARGSARRCRSAVCAPREPVERTLAPGRADAGAQLGVAERAEDAGGERVRVAGRHEQAGLAVGARRPRAPRRRWWRRAARRTPSPRPRAARSPRRATARPRPRPRRRARRCARW